MNVIVIKTEGRLLQQVVGIEELADGSIKLVCPRCGHVHVHFTHTDDRQVDGLTLAVMHELEKHWQPGVAKAAEADAASRADGSGDVINRIMLKDPS